MKTVTWIGLLLLGVLAAGCTKAPEAAATPAPVMKDPNAIPNPNAGKAAPAGLSTAEKDRIEGKG